MPQHTTWLVFKTCVIYLDQFQNSWFFFSCNVKYDNLYDQTNLNISRTKGDKWNLTSSILGGAFTFGFNTEVIHPRVVERVQPSLRKCHCVMFFFGLPITSFQWRKPSPLQYPSEPITTCPITWSRLMSEPTLCTARQRKLHLSAVSWPTRKENLS